MFSCLVSLLIFAEHYSTVVFTTHPNLTQLFHVTTSAKGLGQRFIKELWRLHSWPERLRGDGCVQNGIPGWWFEPL